MWTVDDGVSQTPVSPTEPEKVEEEDDGAVHAVAEFGGERPEEVKWMETFRYGGKWKLLGNTMRMYFTQTLPS